MHRARWSVLIVASCAWSCIRTLPEIPQTSNGVTISGRVVERDRASGQLVGVAGVRVVARSGALARTDDRGDFTLAALPLGEHRLVLARVIPGHDPLPAKVLDGIVGRADGERIPLGDVELRPPGSLRGHVVVATDPDPARAEGALVAVVDTAFRSVAGATGEYTLARLPEGGTYDVVAFLAGYTPARLTGLSVQANKTDELAPLILMPGPRGSATFSGSARLSTAPAGHAGIAITCTSSVGAAPLAATTDDAGRYALTLPFGLYRCAVAKAGYARAVFPGVAALAEGVLGLPPVVLAPSTAAPFAAGDRDGDGCLDADDLAPDDGELCRDTDGDGIPDSADVCPDDPDPDQSGTACAAPDAPLAITGLTPGRVGVGMALTIRGTGFAARADSHVVTFGGEALATALAATRTRLTVIVPPGARDGPVSVDDGRTTVTSTGALTIVPPPIVSTFTPRRVISGGAVTVRGERLGGARVFVGGLEAAVSGVTDTGLTFAVPPLRQASHAIEVVTDGGRVAVPLPLVILGPVRITALDPPIVGPGQLLRIRGGGFALAPGERIEVTFAGTSSRAVASRVTEDEIRVVVPDDAVTGDVTVHHPAADVASPMPLTVSPSLMVVRDMTPTLALEGTTVRLRGNNLDRAVEVRVAGVPATISSRDPTVLDFVTPVGTSPGRITVVAATGTATSPTGLSVIRRTTVFRARTRNVGAVAFDSMRNALYVGTSSGVLEGDIRSGTWTSTFTAFTDGARITAVPASRHLLYRNVRGVSMLDLNLNRESTCDLPDQVGLELVQQPATTNDGQRAWFVAGGQLIEATIGGAAISCRRFDRGYKPAALIADDDQQLLLGFDFGFVSVDIEPSSLGVGRPLSVWPNVRPSLGVVFLWPPLISDSGSGVLPNSTVWALRGSSANDVALARYGPASGAVPDAEIVVESGLFEQTSNRRFAIGVFRATTTPIEASSTTIIDLALGTLARLVGPHLYAAGDTEGSRLAVVGDGTTAGVVTVYEIEPAPLE